MNYMSLLYFISASFLYQFAGCGTQKVDSTTEIESSIIVKNDQAKATTFILVRHAEKDSIGDDPILTKDGLERAEDLSKMLADIPLTAIYSSDYNRTKQTAKPTAEDKGLEINIYNPREPTTTANEIFSKHSNGVILIVGHSNSTPNFVNTLIGDKQIDHIDESDYDNIFIVRATEIASAEVLHLHYGN